VRRLARTTLLVSLCSLVLAATAQAQPMLMVHGSMSRMKDLTGQRSDGRITFWGWGSGWTWGKRFHKALPTLGRVPIVSLGTTKPGRGEVITPGAIANGKGDGYLKAIGDAIHERGGPIYIRPMAEMNGHWNAYCAYNASGSRRNAAHSQKNYRRAFKRIYLILHGGDRATINQKLANSHMPPVGGNGGDLPDNPASMLKILWNPQGYGSPNVYGNRAAAYYPGDAFVDVVGNDLYDIGFRYAWEANLALFKRYKHKPYAIGEFGLWGIDDPTFIRRMGKFIRTHPRVELAAHFEAESGSTFDLASKPRSRAAYRKYIAPLNR
jgi:hypothetical protein